MAGRGKLLDEIRMAFATLTGDKESRLDIVCAKDIQDCLGIAAIGTIVESQSNHLVTCCDLGNQLTRHCKDIPESDTQQHETQNQ